MIQQRMEQPLEDNYTEDKKQKTPWSRGENPVRCVQDRVKKVHRGRRHTIRLEGDGEER